MTSASERTTTLERWPRAGDRDVAAGRGAGLARAVVWAAWAAMLLVVLYCIARYGRDIPMAEDWTLVAPYTGHEPDLLKWLWSQNNEHRVPLPRLLLLGLMAISGGDFRAGMVASTLLTAGVCAVLMLTAASLRGGRVRWSDLVLPVLLLNLGHWENFVWGWQLQFTSSVALTLLLLAAVLRASGAPGGFWPGLAAVCLVLLPLTGANGLVMALGLAPWALFVGWTAPPEARRIRLGGVAVPVRALWLSAAAAAALALVAFYFVDYHRPPWTPANPGPIPTVKAAVKLFAMGFGSGTATNDRLSGPVAILFLAAAGLLLARGGWAAWRARDARAGATALGLACFLAAAVLVTLAIAYGRAADALRMELPDRYALMIAPALCAAYFVFELYARGLARGALQVGLCAVAVLLLPANVSSGLGWRDWYVGGMRQVEADLAAGVPRTELARRHRAFLMHWSEPRLATGMAQLRDAGLGPFAGLRETAAPPSPTPPAAPRNADP